MAIYSRGSNGANNTIYPLTDHLGSTDAITNSSGTIIVKESFAAFGSRRNGCTWSGVPSGADMSAIGDATRRGYTDHTMLDNIGLIHMNGRVMDPGIGRFVSADPMIDCALNTQGWNRYVYVQNNPLAKVDPSGFTGERPRRTQPVNHSPGATRNPQIGRDGLQELVGTAWRSEFLNSPLVVSLDSAPTSAIGVLGIPLERRDVGDDGSTSDDGGEDLEEVVVTGQVPRVPNYIPLPVALTPVGTGPSIGELRQPPQVLNPSPRTVMECTHDCFGERAAQAGQWVARHLPHIMGTVGGFGGLAGGAYAYSELAEAGRNLTTLARLAQIAAGAHGAVGYTATGTALGGAASLWAVPAFGTGYGVGTYGDCLVRCASSGGESY